MEIFVTANRDVNTTLSLDVEPSNTVRELFDKIDEMKCVNVAYVPPVANSKARLLLKVKDVRIGRVELIDRSRTLSSYNIQDGSELEFSFSLLPLPLSSEKKYGE